MKDHMPLLFRPVNTMGNGLPAPIVCTHVAVVNCKILAQLSARTADDVELGPST